MGINTNMLQVEGFYWNALYNVIFVRQKKKTFSVVLVSDIYSILSRMLYDCHYTIIHFTNDTDLPKSLNLALI